MIEITTTRESQSSASEAVPARQAMAAALDRVTGFGRQVATLLWLLWGELTGNHRVFPD